MGAIEECRGSDKLKITYQPWRAGGINFIFATDGREGVNGAGTGATEYFIKNAVDYRVEPNLDKDRWVIWGKGVSKSSYDDGINIDAFCGDTFYWITNAVRTQDLDQVTLITNHLQQYRIRYADGGEEGSFWGLVDSETYAKRNELPLKSTPFSEYYGAARILYNGEVNGVTAPGYPDCLRIGSPRIGVFAVERDSLELLDVTLSERYFRFIAILENGREQAITERVYQEVETEPVDAFQAEPIEIEFSKPSKSYDFFIDDLDVYFLVRYKHINFNLGNTLGYIASDPGQPPPEYSYSCDVELCGDNEYQLDCGDHWCCYRGDGIATNKFDK